MKKYWLILLGTVALSTVSFAQNCTPDVSIVTTGVYPNVTENFKDAYVGDYYEQVAQIKVIKDTVIDFQGTPTAATVLYAVVDSVIGMPPSMTYGCNPANCQIPGGDVGCTFMYGTPTIAEENQTYNLTIYTTLYGLPNAWLGLNIDPIPFPVEFTDYNVTVQPSSNAVNAMGFKLTSKVYPNPATDVFNISINTSNSTDVAVIVYNLIGEKVYVSNESISEGDNTLAIQTTNLKSGVYMVSVIENNTETIHKLILK